MNNNLRKILNTRKRKTQEALAHTSTDGWLIISKGNDPNLEFLLGTHPSNTTIALITQQELNVIVSSLEESLIHENADELSTYYGMSEFIDEIHNLMDTIKGKTIMIDNTAPFLRSHASNILGSHEKMITQLGDLYGIQLKSAHEFTRKMRTTKSEREANTLQEAVKKTLKVLDKGIGRINEENTEKELAAELYRGIHTYGSPAFDPIVAVGKATRNPHYIPQKKMLKDKTLFYIDMGIKLDSVCADITRTYFISQPTKKQVNAYKTLVEAQNRAIESIKSGIKASKPDKIARKVIKENGFDPEKFSHGLGHALGVEAHDVGPSLSQHTEKKENIQAGQFYTIEPGLYFDDWGIRLEDDIIVREDTVKRLSKPPQKPPILDL